MGRVTIPCSLTQPPDSGAGEGMPSTQKGAVAAARSTSLQESRPPPAAVRLTRVVRRRAIDSEVLCTDNLPLRSEEGREREDELCALTSSIVDRAIPFLGRPIDHPSAVWMIENAYVSAIK